jgi:molybdopterin-guanine dinucleotide biosynthesis protein A
MDPMQAMGPGRQRLLHPGPGTPTSPGLPPLRCCLLSGGSSRRMGRDKALLPHPDGGTWLERSLRLLASLQAPITLLSRHPAHLALARQLAAAGAIDASAPLLALAEPPPWEGPLRALERLLRLHPGERLLLCPVDMPWLDRACLLALRAASEAAGSGRADPDGTAEAIGPALARPAGAPAPEPPAILLAHDGSRLQPLLGLYPPCPARLERLGASLAAGERSLQRWLAGERWQPLTLPAPALRNVNRPEQLPGADPPPEGRQPA